MSFEWEHDDGIRVTTRRARIIKVDDSKSQQRVDIKGLKNERPEKVWRPQDFGSTSVPPKDGDGILSSMGSRSDRMLYRDGGHEKYRPKNTPEGCKAIFNMHGDIIRVFKDNADVVHQKKVNIRVGKGYDAENGGEGLGEGEIDDKSSEDEKTISIVLDGDTITLTYEDSSVKIESGKITHTSPHVVIKSDHVDLGDEGGTLIGLCGGGCATKVWAV